jgi:hypothetical protein
MTGPLPPRRLRVRRLLPWLTALLACTGGARALSAQPVAGVGEDAVPIPARGWRVAIGATWDQWDRRLVGAGDRRPLLDALSTPALGPAQLPRLAPVEAGVRSLLGSSSFDLSLGPLEARGAVRRASTLLQADVGLTRRVSLGVRVPYVEVVHDAQLVLNRDGTGATVGRNPARTNDGARNGNGRVHTLIESARASLASAIASCTDTPDGDGCAPILADLAAANALVARAAEFAAAWRTVYGDGSATPGGPVVPVTGSDAHTAIGARLAALSTDFARFGTDGIPRAVPFGADLLYGSAGLQQLAQDTAFGVNADTLDRAFRAGMGDVDVEARVLLFDTWNADQAARLTSGRSGVRLLASAGWRFGAASSAQAAQPFALATGDGVNAMLLRATADAVWKQRAWISATVRGTLPLSDQAVVRFPGVDLPEAFLSGTPQAVTRSLGRQVDLELAPRLNLGEQFGVSAAWRVRSQAADRYLTADGDTWERASGTAQFGAIGVTYSTLAPFVRGKSRHAVEVTFVHEVALSANGLVVPSLVRDRLELRVYPGFPRR